MNLVLGRNAASAGGRIASTNDGDCTAVRLSIAAACHPRSASADPRGVIVDGPTSGLCSRTARIDTSSHDPRRHLVIAITPRQLMPTRRSGAFVRRWAASFYVARSVPFGEGLSGESDDLDEVVEGGEIIGVPGVERKVRGACSGRDQEIDCSRSAGLSAGRNDR